MSSVNMSMVITTTALIILLSMIVLILIVLRQKTQQVKTLSYRVDVLNSEIASLKIKTPPEAAVPEAYIQFIYNLSHEVSNPLQSIQTNLENMADCTPEEAGRWKQYYVIIRNEMRRLAILTENLRLLSHLESAAYPVKREPVNLKSVIEDVIMAQAERAETRKISLSYQGPNRPAKVLGSRDLLFEVIMNLVDNSIKYAKDSGGEVAIILSEDPNFTHVMVKDTGIGIPQEDLPFIFDTAYRSSNKLTVHRTGSGLGLAIVKRIVEQHEGTVKSHSILGEGTTITVDFPIYKPSSLQENSGPVIETGRSILK